MKLHPVFKQSALALAVFGATPLLNEALAEQEFAGELKTTQIGHYYCGPEISGHVDILAGDHAPQITPEQKHRHCVDSDNWPAMAIEHGDTYYIVFPKINEQGRSHPPAQGEVFQRERMKRALIKTYNKLDKLEYGETFEPALDPYSQPRPPVKLQRVPE